MQLTSKLARCTGFAIIAAACVTAMSLSACSKSHDEKSSEKSSAGNSSSAASTSGPASVQGQVASVSGNSVQVAHGSETSTVDLSPSAKITEYTNAQLSDFATGNCVRVNFTPAPNSGPGTAIAVQQNLPGPGDKCPQPKTVPSGSPGALLPAGPAQAVVGTISSLTGNTIDVAASDANGNPSQTSLTVNEQTRYTKGVAASPQAIAQGKCINVSGTKNGGGQLQASVVILTPANNGKCPGK